MKRYILLFLALTALVLLLSACDVSALLEGLGGAGGTTTAAATTASPTTTAPSATTAPPVTTAPPAISNNPIKKVTMKNGALQLQYTDNSKQSLGAASVREGYNGVEILSHSLNEAGILTLTLLDNATKNVALQILEEAPAPTALRLREMNGNLEWASADIEDWKVLCTAKISGKSVLARLAEAAGIGKQETIMSDAMSFVIKDNEVGFRARNWVVSGRDIYTTGYKIKENRGVFQLSMIYEVDASSPADNPRVVSNFKGVGDEITPLIISETAIGSNHGYVLANSVPGTGLAEEDIGKVFTRTTDNQKYVLVRFMDGKAFFCPFDDDTMKSGDFIKYCYGSRGQLKAGDVLTVNQPLAAGGTTYTAQETAVIDQLRCAANHVEQHAYLNGTVEVDLSKNGVYDAEFIDFYESYDVVYLPDMLNYLMENAGYNNNDSHHDDAIEGSYITFVSTFRFHKNGSYTVYQDNIVHKDLKKVKYYGVMSGSFGGQQYLYAPGSESLALPTQQTGITAGSPDVNAFGDIDVRSFYQMTDAVGTKVMAVGYHPYYGLATDEARADALTQVKQGDGSYKLAWWYYSGKTYPHLFCNATEAGQRLNFIGYHTPTASFDEDFFAIDWYFVGDEIYLTLNTDHAVGEKTVTLPNSLYLEGMLISVDKQSDTMQCHSTAVGAGATVTVSSTGAGYITLKLSPAY